MFATTLWLVPWAIPWGVAGLVRPAFAQESTADEEARVLFRAGQIAFEDGRFQNALDSFRRAYALTRRASLLYNIGVSAERLRLDAEALAAYEQFLAEVPETPEGPNRLQLSARMEIIRRSIAAAAAPREALDPADATRTVPPVAVPVATEAAVRSDAVAPSDETPDTDTEASAPGTSPSESGSAPVATSDRRRGPLRWPWYGAGSISLVGASVAIGAGVHLGGEIDTCDRAVASGGSCSNADALSTRRIVSIVSGSASGVLGATLVVIGATRRRGDEGAVSFVCAPGLGASVACVGSF